MKTLLHEIEKDIKNQFEDAPHRDGRLEHMEEKIDRLESAVAHLAAFIAIRLGLDKEETYLEDGLTDW